MDIILIVILLILTIGGTVGGLLLYDKYKTPAGIPSTSVSSTQATTGTTTQASTQPTTPSASTQPTTPSASTQPTTPGASPGTWGPWSDWSGCMFYEMRSGNYETTSGDAVGQLLTPIIDDRFFNSTVGTQICDIIPCRGPGRNTPFPNGKFANQRNRVCQGISCDGTNIEYRPCQVQSFWTGWGKCQPNNGGILQQKRICFSSDDTGEIITSDKCYGSNVQNCTPTIPPPSPAINNPQPEMFLSLRAGVKIFPCSDTSCSTSGNGYPFSLVLANHTQSSFDIALNNSVLGNPQLPFNTNGIAFAIPYGLSAITVFDGANYTGNSYVILITNNNQFTLPSNEDMSRVIRTPTSIAIKNLTGLGTVKSVKFTPDLSQISRTNYRVNQI